MKKIRMTACVLILALAVCVLAGCSNKNNTGMADEATTAARSAPKGQNGRADGQNGTMGETANPAAENRGDVQESTGVVDGLVNDVENAVDR